MRFLLLLLVCTEVALSLQRLPIEQWKSKRVLFVGAHSDDIEATAGGTISLLAKQGTHMEYLVVTNGDKGGSCYNSSGKFYPCSSPEIAVTRRNEQLQAANYLKIKKVHFLNLEDGMLTSYPEVDVRKQMTVIVRSVKPDVVFTWFPYPDLSVPPGTANCPKCWSDLGYHPDHQCTGRICLDTVIGPSARTDFIFPDLADAGLESWQPDEFYMVGLLNNGITHYVDITGDPMQAKINAFLIHKSQVGNNQAIVEETFTWIAQQLGTPSGSQRAENFIVFNWV